jgi:hypothetical protein
MSSLSRRRKILATIAIGGIWLVSLALGLRSLFSYETTPGKVGAVPKDWPAKSKIARTVDQDTLIMLAHPHCPCTSASMAELAQIMTETRGKVHAYVLFLKPENSTPDWDDTSLRRAAGAIPGVTVVTDVGGVEARRFGAETSGHTVLFDSTGKRLFSGGITASRGHAGGNVGESAIVALVNGQTINQTSTLVFGCGLTSAND